MDQKASQGNNGQNNARDGDIERVIKRFASHWNFELSFAEVKLAAVSVVGFGDSRWNVYYLPISAFYKTVWNEETMAKLSHR